MSLESQKGIENVMIASNCNTVLNACDYSNYWKCLAFVSANLVHIYDTVKVKTYLTLKGHGQRANSVKWIDNTNSANEFFPELLSCSADGSICHWINKSKKVFEHNSWTLLKKYTDNSDNSGINYITSLFISSSEAYFATFSTNGNLNVWAFSPQKQIYELKGTVSYKKKLQDVIALTVLDKDYLLLLSGGYDNLINVHIVKRLSENENNENKDLKKTEIIEFKLSLQGHVNSIRDLAFSPSKSGDSELKGKDLLFASCSQDTYIRLWHVSKISKEEIDKLVANMNKKEANSIYEEYKTKMSYVFRTKEQEYFNIVLDSVLAGHEEPVSSVRWGVIDNKNVLLSSSFDFTLGLWKWDDTMNLWNRDYTIGEMTGNKHAFFSALLVEDNKSILAYTYTGALYLWRINEQEKLYKSQPIVHGHFGSVSDIDWDPTKSFLISTSKDQTSRIYAHWKKNGTWHEINRPQVHGYDINAICALNLNKNQTEKFVCNIISGADEKILRVFTPPFSIVKYLQNLSEINLNYSRQKENSYFEKYYAELEGSKQALGLMNRQVRLEATEGGAGEDDENFDFSSFNPDVLTNQQALEQVSKVNFSQPPDEDFLYNNTLWPENSKLYGHGYEVISIASSRDGTLIASGGKSQSEKHSKLFLWDANKNNLLKKLDGHVLTIVQIEFSYDDKYILSVSRDRSLCLFEKTSNGKDYELVQIEKETHARIIWGCSWAKDSELFLTGSRDNTLKVWKKASDEQNLSKPFKEVFVQEFSDAVTSVNLLDELVDGNYIGFVGLENGEISVIKIQYELGSDKVESDILVKVPEFIGHGMAVKRIKSYLDAEQNIVKVATCSEDHSVRIFEVGFAYLQKLLSTKKQEN